MIVASSLAIGLGGRGGWRRKELAEELPQDLAALLGQLSALLYCTGGGGSRGRMLPSDDTYGHGRGSTRDKDGLGDGCGWLLLRQASIDPRVNHGLHLVVGFLACEVALQATYEPLL